MGLVMEAAGKAGIKYFVLDRVNPISGDVIDGPMLTGKTSFVGYHRIPVRYGMTIGELAQMYKDERHLKTDLTVVQIEGWKRGENIMTKPRCHGGIFHPTCGAKRKQFFIRASVCWNGRRFRWGAARARRGT